MATKLTKDELYFIDDYDFTLYQGVDIPSDIKGNDDKDWQVEHSVKLGQIDQFIKSINLYYVDKSNYSDEASTLKKFTLSGALLSTFVQSITDSIPQDDLQNSTLSTINLRELIGDFLSLEFEAYVFPNTTHVGSTNKAWSSFAAQMETRLQQVQESVQSSKLLLNLKRFSNPSQF